MAVDAAPPLAVVAATRRRPEALGRLLAALRRQSLPAKFFSVTVVNDGSHDARYARALAPHRPFLRYLSLPRRAGPAAARNRGAADTGSRWLVFTDDDCAPPPGWLETLWSHARTGARGDLVGGRVLPSSGEPLGSVGRFLRDGDFLRLLSGREGEVLCVPSANLAVRALWFRRVGGFDARYPRPGGEDLDLTHRLIRAGARVAILDSWVTYHDCRCGLLEFCRRYFRYGRGEMLFRRLRGGAGLPPALPHLRRLRLLLELFRQAARPRALDDRTFRLLAAARQVSYELGRLAGSFC